MVFLIVLTSYTDGDNNMIKNKDFETFEITYLKFVILFYNGYYKWNSFLTDEVKNLFQPNLSTFV